jgi:drug/metabolite transporter (DMT)-like permease
VVVVTGLPMVFGSVMLGSVSGFWAYIPHISLTLFAILIFLSLINTTIAFTVFNVALQRLTAIEANVITNTMLVQIALLSWIFLGEPVTWKMVGGMALVIGGVILVTLRGER